MTVMPSFTQAATMGDIYRDGAFVEDIWQVLGADEAIGDQPALLVPVARFLAEREAVLAAKGRLGLVVSPSDRIEDVVADLASFETIAIEFPKFNDGRGFSHARHLADRHGYRGELRAVGEVLLDQIPLMRRVGITAYVITNAPTRRELLAGHLPAMPVFYQPAADATASVESWRPWLRRPA